MIKSDSALIQLRGRLLFSVRATTSGSMLTSMPFTMMSWPVSVSASRMPVVSPSTDWQIAPSLSVRSDTL